MKTSYNKIQIAKDDLKVIMEHLDENPEFNVVEIEVSCLIEEDDTFYAETNYRLLQVEIEYQT